MKAFVTGGTGFIGGRVVEQLIERGYDVICLVRRPEGAVGLQRLGANLVQGDITNRESMREGMVGADVVFHIAGWYEIGLSPDAGERMERVNVLGTENVIGLAVELGVPKIVYTSTAGVLGDTHRMVVDETFQRDSPFTSAYDRSKYQAHQIAERHIAQSAAVIIVMPGAVYGPGDSSIIATFLRLILRRMLPVLPGADTGFSLVHVDDMAQGHVLAAEKGEIGQVYLLGGDVMMLGDAVQTIARLAGVPAPLIFTGFRPVAIFEPLANWLEGFVPLPPLLSTEMIRQLGATWMFTSAKAKQALGYTHRSFEEGMAETIAWEITQSHSRAALVTPQRQAGVLLALAAGVSLISFILLRRRHNS